MDKYLIKKPATTPEKAAPPTKKLKMDSKAMSHTSADSGNSEDSRTASAASSSTSTASGGKSGFQLKFKNGDLFKCPSSHSLAHCISEDIRMGKGIATIFKKEFGGVEELKRQGVKPGGVAVLKRDDRFIYYLVTKEKYWQKPTYNTLQSSLEAMANHCREHKVTRVSMPRIGCGLDMLKWETVEAVIKEVFKDHDMTATVYTLEMKGKKKK